MRTTLALVVLGGLLASAVGFGGPLLLCDYRSPQTDLTDMHLGFNYRYFDDPATVETDVSSGRLALSFSRLVDAPGMGYTLAGSAEIALADLRPSSGLGQASGTLRFYMSEEMPCFAFGGFETSAATATEQPQIGLEVRTGFGYGRFSDVTPLAKAFTIEEELLDLEAIPDTLADDVLLAVAAEIGREAEYETIDDLVAAVEGLIEGAAGVELDAWSILAIEETILAVGDERYCGWAVQAGIGYELVDPYGGEQDFVIAASADAAFAPEPGSQLLLHASFSGPFEIVEENTLIVTASYDVAVNETASLIAGYTLQRVKPAQQEATDSQSATIEVAFDVGGADVAIQLVVSKTAEATDWSKEVVVSAAMDLF